MNVKEKLEALRAEWEPQVRAKVPRLVAGMVIPQLEDFVDQLLALEPAQLDDIAARLIDRIGRLRSDGARPLFVDVDGACYFELGAGSVLDGCIFNPVDSANWRRIEGFASPVRADPLQRPPADPGPVGQREEHAGPGPVPVGGCPPPGHRPG